MSLMFALHVPRRSPVHAAPPLVKVLVLAAAGIGVFMLDDPRLLAAALGAVMLLFALARLPAGAIWAQLRPVLLVGAFFLAAHVLLTDWLTGLVTALRFIVLMLLAALVTLTTPVSAMVGGLERALRPLRPLGVHPGKISLMITLAIRFVPLLLDQAREIRTAQKARGHERGVVSVVVPLVIKALHLAQTMADAIEARGYDPD